MVKDKKWGLLSMYRDHTFEHWLWPVGFQMPSPNLDLQKSSLNIL